jgi:hypothetical protein
VSPVASRDPLQRQQAKKLLIIYQEAQTASIERLARTPRLRTCLPVADLGLIPV